MKTASLVLGILSVIIIIFPLLDIPVSLTGLILGICSKHKVGIILNAIGLILTIIFTVVGFIIKYR